MNMMNVLPGIVLLGINIYMWYQASTTVGVPQTLALLLIAVALSSQDSNT